MSRSRFPHLTSDLVGREADLERLIGVLRSRTLVTLTGPGGIGKTSLSLAAAASLEANYPDGVYFVELAPITKPEQVLTAILRAIEVDPRTDDPIAAIEEYFTGKNALLILDNFEQVIEAASDIATLRQSLPGLPIIVSSREALRIRGEQEFPLGTLGFPTSAKHFLLSALKQYPALDLFITRIKERDPDFEITERALERAVSICEQLDGLPLALELAAARARSIGLEALSEQLQDGIEILSDGPRDLPKRHQTLMGTIKWSYDLLNAREQQFFRRLGVFPESFTSDAAERIAEADGEAVTLLTSLVEKSLVKLQRGTNSRFLLLATIRQFALEELERTGELTKYLDRHADYFQEYAIRVRDLPLTDKANEWFSLTAVEHDNLRAALQHLYDSGDVHRAAILTMKLWWYWKAAGLVAAGRRWILKLLELGDAITLVQRVRLSFAGASLALFHGRLAEAEQLSRQSVELARQQTDEIEIATALNNCGMMLGLYLNKFEEAEQMLQESIELSQKTNDDSSIGQAVLNLASVSSLRGDFAKADRLYREMIEFFTARNDTGNLALAYGNLGINTRDQGQYAEAATLLEQSIRLAQTFSDTSQLLQLHENLGIAYYKAGDRVRGFEQFIIAAEMTASIESAHFELRMLLNICGMLQKDGLTPAVRRVFESAHALLAEQPTLASTPQLRQQYQELREKVMPEGVTMYSQSSSVVELLRDVKSSTNFPTTPVPAAVTPYSQTPAATASIVTDSSPRKSNPLMETLTEREREVLGYVAQGMKDAEIADKIFVSVRTVNTHLRSIYSKLNITSRSQATRLAIEEGIAS